MICWWAKTYHLRLLLEIIRTAEEAVGFYCTLFIYSTGIHSMWTFDMTTKCFHLLQPTDSKGVYCVYSIGQYLPSSTLFFYFTYYNNQMYFFSWLKSTVSTTHKHSIWAVRIYSMKWIWFVLRIPESSFSVTFNILQATKKYTLEKNWFQ